MKILAGILNGEYIIQVKRSEIDAMKSELGVKLISKGAYSVLMHKGVNIGDLHLPKGAAQGSLVLKDIGSLDYYLDLVNSL